MNLKPKEHQVTAESWMETRPKHILALDMGLGKTMLGVRSIKDGERVLIICPATLKINWQLEIKLWIGKDSLIIKKKSDVLPKGPGITIVNYDLLGNFVKKGKRKIATPNYDFKDFDRVIFDESHMIKNPKAARTKIGGRIIKLTPNAVLLSGTVMERPIDLYVPLFSMGALGKMPYNTFGFKFCDAQQVYLGSRTVWQFRGSCNEEELKKLMEPYVLSMKKEDVIDLPEKSIKVVSLDLPVSKQEKQHSFKDIIKDPRPIGFEGLSELLHEQGLRKLPLAIKHIKLRLETNHKIFITARHSDVIDGLHEALKGFGCVVIDGRIKAEQKQAAKEEFQNNPDCRICIGQTKAAGVGLTLTAANFVILVEPDWSYSAIMQIIDRCHRIGQTENVTAELLTIHKSIDERVLWTTLQKKDYIKGLGL